jgi:hypothetical protein
MNIASATPTADIGYPGDRSPLLPPFGAVFMPWADEAAVAAWLDRAALSAPVADLYRHQLAEVRDRRADAEPSPNQF